MGERRLDCEGGANLPGDVTPDVSLVAGNGAAVAGANDTGGVSCVGGLKDPGAGGLAGKSWATETDVVEEGAIIRTGASGWDVLRGTNSCGLNSPTSFNGANSEETPPLAATGLPSITTAHRPMAKHSVTRCLFLETIIGYDPLNLRNGGWNIPCYEENCSTGEDQQYGHKHDSRQVFHLCSSSSFCLLRHIETWPAPQLHVKLNGRSLPNFHAGVVD